MVKKAQRRLSQHQTLLDQKTLNKQGLKELTKSVHDLKDISSSIQPKLDQLRTRKAELEKELAEVNTAIQAHESELAHVPDAIKQKKQEITVKAKEDSHSQPIGKYCHINREGQTDPCRS